MTDNPESDHYVTARCYVTVRPKYDRRGQLASCIPDRMTVAPPRVINAGEVVVRVDLELPAASFGATLVADVKVIQPANPDPSAFLTVQTPERPEAS